MSNLKTYKVKFFGSKEKREQIKLVKAEVKAEDRSSVEEVLRRLHGWQVINGLKVRQ